MRNSRLEVLLVFGGEPLAQLDEVAPADRDLVGGLHALAVGALEGRREVGVVGQARVAAHAVVVLHAPLGGQAVVVPAHRVEDVLAAHALEARDEVGVGEREHVADVQRTRRRRRGRVDRVDLLAAWPNRGRTGRCPRAPTRRPSRSSRPSSAGLSGMRAVSVMMLRFDIGGTESIVRCLNVRRSSLPERDSGRRIARIRDPAGDRRRRSGACEARRVGHEPSRVRMLRLGEQAIGGARLDDAAGLHHRDAVGHVSHDAQVVRDEQQREAALGAAGRRAGRGSAPGS